MKNVIIRTNGETFIFRTKLNASELVVKHNFDNSKRIESETIPDITASELIWKYNERELGYYFTPSTMRLFGDTVANYYIPKKLVLIETWEGDKIPCYELQRRKPVKEGRDESAYFSCTTFKSINGKVIEK